MSLSLASDSLAFYLRLPEGTWDLHCLPQPGPYLEGARFGLTFRATGRRHRWDGRLAQARVTRPERTETPHGPAWQARVEGPVVAPGLRLRFEFQALLEHPLFLWRLHLVNRSPGPVELDRVTLLRVGPAPLRAWEALPFPFRLVAPRGPQQDAGALRVHPSPGEPAFYTNGWQSWSFTGALGRRERQPRTRLGPLTRPMVLNPGTPTPTDRGRFGADMFGVVGDRQHRIGLVAGFLSQREAFGSLEVRLDRFSPSLALWANGDKVRLEPGQAFQTDWACLAFLNLDAEDPLGPYLEAVGRENRARVPAEAPVGWCSWYMYFEKVRQEDVLENLAWAAANRAEVPLQVFQVDDGYEARVGDWLEPHASFPEGVAALAERIRRAGFRPGLWLAPFVALRGSRLARDHPDWVLRNRFGLPANPGFVWNTFAVPLDVTRPEVLDYVARVIATAVHEWGFTYLKLDFLYAGGLPGKRHDPGVTRAQALRRALKVIRQAAGEEAFLLGCGCPLGSGVGVFDGMRIGPDVAPRWRPAVHGVELFFRHEPDLPAARNALRSALARAPLHRRWWVNDPDCVLMRAEDTRLTADEVQMLATVAALTAGAVINSDALPRLDAERRGWLARLLPPLARPARVLDWFDAAYPVRLSLDLEGAVGRWRLLALLNWADEIRRMQLRPQDLPGEGPWHVMDFWRGDYLLLEDPEAAFGLAPHGVRLLAVRPAGERPAWLGDTLHVSMGLAVREWRVQARSLRASLALGRRARGTGLLALPAPPSGATLDGAPLTWTSRAPSVYALDLAFEGEAHLEVAWG